MQLGTALIVAFMILVIFGVVDTPLCALGLRKGWILTLLFVVLLANAAPVAIIPEISLNPAALLILLCAGIWAARGKNGFWLGLMLALPAGAAIWLLQRADCGAEPGLLYGLVAGMISCALVMRPKGALFAAAAAPFFAQIIMAVEELVDFGYTRAEAGGGVFFDTMIAGMLCVMLISSLSFLRAKRPRTANP